jgi:hypothetical protein
MGPEKATVVVGAKFGRLTVMEKLKSTVDGKVRWQCTCECGGTAVTYTHSLRSGRTQSCGCIRREVNAKVIEDRHGLVGQRFGRLTVVEKDPVQSRKHKKQYWMTKCDCGGNTCTTTADLRSGHTQSCGCLRNERAAEAARKTHSGPKLEAGVSGFNRYRKAYKYGAKIRELAWEIGSDDLRALSQQECYYCGSEPQTIWQGSAINTDTIAHGEFVANGIDRVDSGKGYTPDNVVACCKNCNRAKNALGLGEFISLVHTIASRHPVVEVREGEGPPK